MGRLHGVVLNYIRDVFMEWYLTKHGIRLHGVVLNQTRDASSWCCA
jgi:hypothetical protein